VSRRLLGRLLAPGLELLRAASAAFTLPAIPATGTTSFLPICSQFTDDCWSSMKTALTPTPRTRGRFGSRSSRPRTRPRRPGTRTAPRPARTRRPGTRGTRRGRSTSPSARRARPAGRDRERPSPGGMGALRGRGRGRDSSGSWPVPESTARPLRDDSDPPGGSSEMAVTVETTAPSANAVPRPLVSGPALAGLQGAFYVATGVWPLIDIDSFQAVTGPKADLWLVYTVGGLIAAVGAVVLTAAWSRRVSPETGPLGRRPTTDPCPRQPLPRRPTTPGEGRRSAAATDPIRSFAPT
jgi:hypothetical protein